MQKIPDFDPFDRFVKFYEALPTLESKHQFLVASKKKFKFWVQKTNDIFCEVMDFHRLLNIPVDEQEQVFIAPMHAHFYPVETCQVFHVQMMQRSIKQAVYKMANTTVEIPKATNIKMLAATKGWNILQRAIDEKLIHFNPAGVFIRTIDELFATTDLWEKISAKYSRDRSEIEIMMALGFEFSTELRNSYLEHYTSNGSIVELERNTLHPFRQWYKIEMKFIKQMRKIDKKVKKGSTGPIQSAESRNKSLEPIFEALLKYGMNDCSLMKFSETLATGKGELEFSDTCVLLEIGLILQRLRDTGYFNAKAAKNFRILLIGEKEKESKTWDNARKSANTYVSEKKNIPPYIKRIMNLVHDPKP